MNYFDSKIHAVAWQQTKFLNWFMGFPGTKRVNGPSSAGAINGRNRAVSGGLIRSVDEGLENIVTWKWEKMKPGQIASSLQEAPTQRTKITELTGPLMTLATKVAFPVNEVDAWRHNQYVGGVDIMAQAISQAIMPLTQQVDQFIIYGDRMKDTLNFDRLGAVGKFTGLFNGFTTFRAGTGLDDDMGAKGDLFTTYVTARSALRTAGFDIGPYYILSDETTQANMEKGNLLYLTGTQPISEYTAFMRQYRDERKQVADWIESINAFPGDDTDESRICVTQPYITQRGRKIEPAYALFMGYNFKVWPLYAGGLNANAEYEFLIAVTLRLQEYNAAALQRSQNDLTFTG
jgi:hypothetical protein